MNRSSDAKVVGGIVTSNHNNHFLATLWNQKYVVIRLDFKKYVEQFTFFLSGGKFKSSSDLSQDF